MGRLLFILTLSFVVACAKGPAGSVSHSEPALQYAGPAPEYWLKQDLATELRSGGIKHCGGYENPPGLYIDPASKLAVSVNDSRFKLQDFEVRDKQMIVQMPGSTFHVEYVSSSLGEVTEAIAQRDTCLKRAEKQALSGKPLRDPVDVENVAIFNRAQLITAVQKAEAELNSPESTLPIRMAQSGLTLGAFVSMYLTVQLQSLHTDLAKLTAQAEIDKLAKEIAQLKKTRVGTVVAGVLSAMVVAWYYFKPDAGRTPAEVEMNLSALKRMMDYDEVLFTQYIRRHPEHARLINSVVSQYAPPGKARKAQ